MGEGTIIKTEHLSKYYRSGTVSITALDNISLEIKKGSFTSIMGESGSGKSTLLHLISGIERPSKGTIEILGFRAAPGIWVARSNRQSLWHPIRKGIYHNHFQGLTQDYDSMETLLISPTVVT